MRPRHKAAENGFLRRRGARQRLASMRPRHKAAENDGLVDEAEAHLELLQ